MKKADNFNATKWLVENKITTQSKLKEWSNDDDSDWMDQEEDDPNDYDEEGNMKDDAYRREFGYSFQEKQNYEKILDQVKEKYNFDPFDTNSLKNYDKIEAEAKEMYAQKYGSSFGESKLNEGSDTYPFQADSETISLYDKIANELEGTISMVASKLEIPKSDIRICLDYLYDDLEDNKSKKKGMFIQVKADDAKWDKAWTGNPLIMQTTNDEGVVIPSNPFFGVSIKGNKNPKVRAIYNKALDLDLEILAASENAKIADLVSPEEMKLIAPNTPIVVTGK